MRPRDRYFGKEAVETQLRALAEANQAKDVKLGAATAHALHRADEA